MSAPVGLCCVCIEHMAWGFRIAADLGSFMGLGDGAASHPPLPPSPFRLPPAYEDAKEKKVAAVAELRNAVKSVRLDLCLLAIAHYVSCLVESHRITGLDQKRK